MIKLLLVPMLASLLLISHAQSDIPPDTNRYEWSARTVTHEGRVRVTITKTKHRTHLARQPRPVIHLVVNDDDTDYYDESPEFQVGYRRPELVDQTPQVHDDISDEIKIRLILARKRALEAYHATWA